MKTAFTASILLVSVLIFSNCQKSAIENEPIPDNTSPNPYIGINLDQNQFAKVKGETVLLLIHKPNHCIGAFSFSIDTNGIPFFERNSPLQEAYVVLDTLIEINSENNKIALPKKLGSQTDSLNISLVTSKLEMFNQTALLQNQKFQLSNVQFKNYASLSITTSTSMIAGNEIDGSTVKLFIIDLATTDKQIDSLLDNYKQIKLRSECSLITETIETPFIKENDKQENLYIRQFTGVSFFPFVAAESKYLILFEKNEDNNILFEKNSIETQEMWKIVHTKNAMLYGFRLAERN